MLVKGWSEEEGKLHIETPGLIVPADQFPIIIVDLAGAQVKMQRDWG
jgi:hypothetical protein